MLQVTLMRKLSDSLGIEIIGDARNRNYQWNKEQSSALYDEPSSIKRICIGSSTLQSSSSTSVDGRTARRKKGREIDKKRNKNATRLKERKRAGGGEGRGGGERGKRNEDGIGPVTNTQGRTPGCSFARWCEETIRHDVFLVSPPHPDVMCSQCVLYIRRFCCFPDQ